MFSDWFKRARRDEDTGIAFSGGGVLGASHAGVLRALHERELQPGYYTGTSSGAMYAVLAAFGVPIDEIETITRDLSWWNISGVKLGRLGLMSNDKIGELVREAIGSKDLSEARVPVAVIATDIAAGERVLVRDGDAGSAVMASACIPGFFHPVRHAGRMLVDGGLVENLPLRALTELGASYRIGVDVSERRGFSEPEGMLEVLSNAIDIAVHAGRQLGDDRGDLMICPDTSSFNRLDTSAVPDIIEAGYRAAIEALGAS